ncbi:hypothetical protein GIX45_11915 [Erwinia sp. CPCC 100877]|nr:hypothetical protein [Erwinia sp. CPCC 100877]
MIKKIAITACAFMLCACSSVGKISDIDTGMSKQQIIAKLGNPDKSYSRDGLEVLTYLNRKPQTFSFNRKDYQVILINDTAAEITPASEQSK